MVRRNAGTILVVTVLALLFLVAFVIALTIDHLPELAIYLAEDLFGIVLAVFVLERMLTWREERRWLGAKRWLHMIVLEAIDDLVRELLPTAVPKEGEDTDGETTVYEATGARIHFGEVVAYGQLRLLISPGDKDLQSYILWYANKLEPPVYASLAKAALSNAREHIRDTFGSSARLMEADITAMLMNLERAMAAAIEHIDSATSMRDEQLENTLSLDNKESAKQRIREADHQLALTTSIIVESVISSAMKPKAWLEDQLHRPEDGSLFEYMEVSSSRR